MYDGHVSLVTAFVLAGGKSTRMGADKAFLDFGGAPLLVHALKLASVVASEVHIVGEAQKFSAFSAVVEDLYPERGPLGGIHAALSNSVTDFNLMLAVDIPFVQPEFLRYLVSLASASGAMVTVPRANGGFQPLCAVYRAAFAKPAETALQAGRNKIDSLFAEVSLRIIEEDEMQRGQFSSAMFRNLNTPEEWRQARAAGLIQNAD